MSVSTYILNSNDQILEKLSMTILFTFRVFARRLLRGSRPYFFSYFFLCWVRHLTFYPSAERICLCIRLNNAGKVGLRSTYRRCRFWQTKNIFSDEAHFELGGYVNKQNARIHWKADAPKRSYCLVRIFVQRHNWNIFLRKWAIFNEFSFTKIKEENIGNIWFQQDGATCHKVEATLDVLRSVFEDRINSRRSDVVWPPRSCNLTPLNYYLWGAVKDKCYADKSEPIDALKDNEMKLFSIINRKDCTFK